MVTYITGFKTKQWHTFNSKSANSNLTRLTFSHRFIIFVEKFYNNQDQIVQAIANNIYPSPPARDLYFVSKGKPANPATIHFLNWILTDGQKFVKSNGYIELSTEKIASSINKIK